MAEVTVNDNSGQAFSLLREKLQKKANESVKNVAPVMAKKVSAKVEELCLQAVQEFYDSYSPVSEGGYDRTYSMKSMYMDSVKNGEENTTIFEYWNDPSKMTQFERSSNKNGEGAGLYELVYQEGWHGGAKRDTKKNLHPNPGTPYWRAPPTENNRWGAKKYGWWKKSGPASRSDVSPRDRQKQLVDDYFDNELVGEWAVLIQNEFNRLLLKGWWV